MKRVIFRAEARTDALDAFDWYESQRTGLGAEFREALDTTIARALVNPEAYAPGYRKLRRAIVRRFPYGVYFRIEGEVLLVVGVLHLKRHPGIGRGR